MAAIDSLLRKAREVGASDLHVVTGSPPLFRVTGELRPVKLPALTEAQVKGLSYEIIEQRLQEEFERKGHIDFAYSAPQIGRFRANLMRNRAGISVCFRIIPPQAPPLDRLGLPDVVKEFCELHQGVVLITGPGSSGKTTTLASMVDHINRNFDKHVLTIEDPIEIVHTPMKSIVNQREIGRHTKSGMAAMRGALRENPDVILVGELRDPESIELALSMAETGHLVLGTMMTSGAAKTVDRLIESFPAGAQNQVRVSLSETLKGVISQALVRPTQGRHLVMAAEVLVITGAVSNLIRDGKTYQLQSVMQTGKAAGMQRMDDALAALVEAGRIPVEAAIKNAQDPRRFASLGRQQAAAI